MPEVKIGGSFELLLQDEWDKYLGTDIFNDMRVDDTYLGASDDIFASLSHP
ncbi:MAG: hypothetical protein ABFD04_03605 [Syntrophomonas sp.]